MVVARHLCRLAGIFSRCNVNISFIPSRKLRAAGRPTLPSTLGEERATNPFLRWREPAVVESANKYLGSRVSDPVRVFAAIRDWKNRA